MLPCWWRLFHAFVKSISFAFGLLWPFSNLSQPLLLHLLVSCVDTMEHHPHPSLWTFMILLQPFWLILYHQLPAASFLRSLCHTCLFGAGGCWWISFALSSLFLLLCILWCPLPVQFPHLSFLALLVVWVFFYWCPNYFGGIHFATFSSLLLPKFILRPAFLLKTGADGSLVPLFLSSSQEPLSCCIQSTTSSSGTCFSPCPAQSPPWSTVPMLGQSDPASPGAFQCSTSAELRLPVLLQCSVSITTLSVMLCVAVRGVASVPSLAIAAIFSPARFSICANPTSLSFPF